MTRKNHFISAVFFTALLSAGSMQLHAQNALATVPPAKTTPVTPAAPTADDLAKLRLTIEQNPNSLEAHEAYLKASGFTKYGTPEDPAFVKQYEDWMKKFPNSAVVAYALGHAFAGKESPKAKPYLLRAVEIDPGFDKAYFDLWIDGERWGDFKASAAYLAKAKNAAPSNPDYAFYYANTFSNTDVKEYKRLSLDVAKNFPNTERGAQALYWLGNRIQNTQEKIAFYEQQKRDFPADKFSWTSSGMSEYYGILLKSDASKALALAQEMLQLKGKDARDAKAWDANIVLAKNIMQVQALLSEGKTADAAAVMDKVAVPRYSTAKEYIVFLKSRTLDGAGKTEEAYKNLLSVYAKEPTEELSRQMIQYGNKLGKDQSKVNEDIWYMRDTAAKDAPDFNLENYFTKNNVSLSDYKGKVVLITYWFPGCGPCRGEFPHFENVVKKFKGRNDFVYLGINIVADQDDYVLPFMKSSGYSFTPLKDNDKWQKGPLDNRNAAPVNFLLGPDGKIIFANFRTDAGTEQTLETMISSTLSKKVKKA
ncbi:MAG: redoxin protein [Chitinophagaceae bacterium]|nr:redoxin protein [Chitinophagaceae bacterium]